MRSAIRAMAFRDAHDETTIIDADWPDIERQLRGAYGRLRVGVRG
jgi:hypothetical protein